MFSRDKQTGRLQFVIWRPKGGWRNLIGVPLGVVIGIVALPLVALVWLFARKWDRTPAEMQVIANAIIEGADFESDIFDSAHDAWFAAEVRDRRLEALRREGNQIEGPPFNAEALAKWVDIRERLKALATTAAGGTT